MNNRDISETTHNTFNLTALTAAAISIVGLCFLIPALCDLITQIIQYLNSTIRSSNLRYQILVTAIRFLLALWLFLGSKPIARFINKTRNFTVEKATENQDG